MGDTDRKYCWGGPYRKPRCLKFLKKQNKCSSIFWKLSLVFISKKLFYSNFQLPGKMFSFDNPAVIHTRHAMHKSK